MTDSEYMPTGNLAVDAVGAAISHCRRYNRRPERIRLDEFYWRMFVDYVKRKDEECYDKYREEIMFENVLVIRGNRFMKDSLEIDFPEVQKQNAEA